MPKSKFQVGDYVRYSPETPLVDEFVEQWGRGPFIVKEILTSLDRGDFPHLALSTPHHVTLICPYSRSAWRCHQHSGLEPDPFFSAVKKAITDAQV